MKAKNLTLSLFIIPLMMFFSQTMISQNCLPGGITFSTQTEIDNFTTNYPGCSIIDGYVTITGTTINDLTPLSVLTEIGGNLNINGTSLTTFNGLHNVTQLGGGLEFSYNNITSPTGLTGLTRINGNLNMDEPNLTNLSGLNNLDSIMGSLYLEILTSLTDITALNNLTHIQGQLYAYNCHSLNDFTGLDNLAFIGNGISFYDNNNLSSLDGLDHPILVSGFIGIYDNPLLSDCSVRSICDFLSASPESIAFSNNTTNCNSNAEVDSICLEDYQAQASVERGKGVAINTDGSSPDSSAILDLKSESTTLILPRVSPIQRRAIKDPPAGSVVYDYYIGELYYFDGADWKQINRGDNLGNHQATQNLDMNQDAIEDVWGLVNDDGEFWIDTSGRIGLHDETYIYSYTPGQNHPSAAFQILSSARGVLLPSMPFSSLPPGPADGLLVYDNTNHRLIYYNGSSSSWTPVGIDNLGNHTATQNLNMAGYELNLNGGWLSGDGNEEGVFVDGVGKVGIGLSTPAQTLDVSGTAQMTGFKLTPMGASGQVLTSDGTQGIWQALPPGADNLGNHTATQNLNMNSNRIISVDRLGLGTSDPEADIQIGSTLLPGSSAAVSIQDGSNNPFFMIGEDSNNMGRLWWNRTSDEFRIDSKHAGTNYLNSLILKEGKLGVGISPTEKLDINGTAQMTGFKLTPMGTSGQVLTSDGTQGIWQTLPPGADNLGDHIATQDLNMAGSELTLNGGWLSGDGQEEGIIVDNNGWVGIRTTPSVYHEINMLGTASMYSPSQHPLIIRAGTSGNGVLIRETDDQYSAIGLFGYNTRGRVSINENGNQKILLDGSSSISSYIDAGKFGLGTTTPDELLHVAGAFRLDGKMEDSAGSAGSSGQVLSSTGTATSWISISGDNLGNHTATQDINMNGSELSLNGGWLSGDGDEEGVYVNTLGNVSIGNSNPSHRLTIQSSDNSTLRLIGPDGSYGHGGKLNFGDGNYVYINECTDDEMRIQASSVGIGKDGVTNKLEVEGDASKTSAGDWLANSDRRIKTSIQGIENSFETMLKLNPVKFKYSDEWLTKHPSIQDKYYYNFIAQEYAEVFPESVKSSGEYIEGDAEEILQIDSYNAQIVTIQAVKDLIEENIELRKRLSALEEIIMSEAKANK